jgi:hypothetical protein
MAAPRFGFCSAITLYKVFFTIAETQRIMADWQVFKEVMAKQQQLFQLS